MIPESTLTAAHFAYRDAGFSTIPVTRYDKRPLAPWKEYQARLPKDAEIRGWVKKYPTSNVGLIMGGMSGHMAVDIDGDINGAYKALQMFGVDLPGTAPVQSSGKGYHVLLSVESPVGDSVAWLKEPGWQIDIRGVGYIVAAPSIHQNGRPYQWVKPFKAPAPPAPGRLIELLAQRERNERALTAPPPPSEPWVTQLLLNGAKGPDGDVPGERNGQATRLAGYLLRHLPADVTATILYLFADKCDPKLPYDEIDTIVWSIGRKTNGSK